MPNKKAHDNCHEPFLFIRIVLLEPTNVAEVLTVRQVCVLGIHTVSNLEGTCAVHAVRALEGVDVVLLLHEVEGINAVDVVLTL